MTGFFVLFNTGYYFSDPNKKIESAYRIEYNTHATPCSDRSRLLQPFTVTFSPELEAPEVIGALHCVPQLDDQSLDDFFEESVDAVERRLTLLSLERNG